MNVCLNVASTLDVNIWRFVVIHHSVVLGHLIALMSCFRVACRRRVFVFREVILVCCSFLQAAHHIASAFSWKTNVSENVVSSWANCACKKTSNRENVKYAYVSLYGICEGVGEQAQTSWVYLQTLYLFNVWFICRGSTRPRAPRPGRQHKYETLVK